MHPVRELNRIIVELSDRQILMMCVLFLAYLLTARMGNLLFTMVPTAPALIWPPAGISIAFLFLEGLVLWPAVALASITNSIINGTPIITTIGVALANTLQALAGEYMLRRLDFRPSISRLRDMAAILGIAILATLIVPTIGLSLAWLDTRLPGINLGERFITWWFGGIFSVVILTPLLVSWISSFQRPKIDKYFWEHAAAFTLLIVISYFMTWTTNTTFLSVSLFYFLFIPLFWIALRFGPKWMTLGILLLAGFFITGMFWGSPASSQLPLGERLLQIELFTILMAVIFFIVSSISEERKLAVEVLKDHVGQLEKALETIRHYSLHDVLTGLPNRKALEERFVVARSIAISHGQKLAILYLDLDRFKNVNETLGHTVGDSVLKEVASRLLDAVRKIDIVARIGGDEFIVILNEIDDDEQVKKIADDILHSFVLPVKTERGEVHVTASLGIAVFPDAGDDIDILLRSSDIALYKAKDFGRNRYQFSSRDVHTALRSKVALERDLRKAISGGEMYLAYQPFVDLKEEKLLGVEALIRWNHPELGILLPFDFILIAEELGIMEPLEDWVLKTACEQIASWKKSGIFMPVSINLSPNQISLASLTLKISEALKSNELQAEYLEVEITEGTAMLDHENTAAKLRELKKLGVSVAIDDFGTGYSSLSYLRGFPVQKLKIDQSFIKDLMTDPQDAAIVETIISMGHTLGLKVCGEGIESEEQQAVLKAMGCDIGQGFFISHPLMSYEFPQWFRRHTNTKPNLAFNGQA